MTAPKITTERYLNTLMKWHVQGSETGAAFSLGEVTFQAGDEPPIHIHAREDEAWYILEGTILFQRGAERITGHPGDAILLPRGIPHGFALQTPAARILHLYSPAGLERAFQHLSVPLSAPPPAADPAAIAATFDQYGVAFVGPPLPALLAQEQGRA